MNLKFFKRITNIFLLGLLVALFVGWVVQPTEDVKIAYESSKTNYLDWFYADTNEPITNEDSIVFVKPGETKTIYAILPDLIMPETSLGFYDSGFHLSMYIDDEKIYECGTPTTRRYGHETGGIWRSVPTKQSDINKKLTIILDNPTSEELNVDTDKLYFCYKNDIPYKILKTSIWSYVLSTIYFFMAAMLFIITFFMFKSNHEKSGRISSILGSLSLCMCLWIFFDGNITQLFISNASYRYGLAVISFIMIPVFLGRYFREVLPSGEKAFNIYVYVYECCTIMAIIFNIARINHIMNFIYMVHALFFVLILMVGHYEAVEIRKNKDLSHVGTAIAFFLISIILIFGLVRYFHSYKSTVSDYVGGATLILFVAILITEGQQNFNIYKHSLKIKNFKEIAKIDSVTGGNSRIAGEEWLEEYSKSTLDDSVWMIHMNLEDFSSVNAMMGWSNGDKILKDIYELNLDRVKAKDLVCSMGSAKYVFLLSNLHNINEFCLSVSKSLSDYLNQNWNGLLLSAKYAAIKVNKNDNLDQLLDSVQFAYTSPLADYNKASNCYYFTEKCREQAKHNLELESNVQAALEKEEFKMYLQPKISPVTNKIEGAEALVRWSNHKIGLIPPLEFIPVLEESGQVCDVDFFMFKKVCDYLLYRQQNGLPEITISVNVSKYGITRPNFFDIYRELIMEMKVPAHCLEFEFTESMAFTDMEAIEKLIQQIHATGATVSMDDFGSAYSNIGAIGRLKFDVVKLDKQFFDNGFPDNEQDYILVRGLINVFHDMNIKVVCEGIETDAQKRALTDLNADLIQGFYYSRPMTTEDFTKWAAENQE